MKNVNILSMWLIEIVEMPLSKLYEKPRSATKIRSFPVKVSTMDAEMKFDDIEVFFSI